MPGDDAVGARAHLLPVAVLRHGHHVGGVHVDDEHEPVVALCPAQGVRLAAGVESGAAGVVGVVLGVVSLDPDLLADAVVDVPLFVGAARHELRVVAGVDAVHVLAGGLVGEDVPLRRDGHAAVLEEGGQHLLDLLRRVGVEPVEALEDVVVGRSGLEVPDDHGGEDRVDLFAMADDVAGRGDFAVAAGVGGQGRLEVGQHGDLPFVDRRLLQRREKLRRLRRAAGHDARDAVDDDDDDFVVDGVCDHVVWVSLFACFLAFLMPAMNFTAAGSSPNAALARAASAVSLV